MGRGEGVKSWATGTTDTLTWDVAGRLLEVSRMDGTNTGFTEQSIYDPLGRRVSVVYTPVTTGTPGTAETTNSWYDPQSEFLEIATVQGSSGVQWKVYGPDENGSYGGLQGVGGLQAVIDTGASKVSAVWSTMLGHIDAYSLPASYTGGSVTPGVVTPQSRSSGYGILPGETVVSRWSQSGATGTTSTLAATLAWQGRRADASGYYSIGAREYNPTAGRFLSPDPLSHSASWDLYSYAGGDPINYIDCTGRSLVQAVQDASLQSSTITVNSGGTLLSDPSEMINQSPATTWTQQLGGLSLSLNSNIDLGGGETPEEIAMEQAQGNQIAQEMQATEDAKPNFLRDEGEAALLVSGLVAPVEAVGELGIFGSGEAIVNDAPVVIGENMQQRVIPFANSIGADYYQPGEAESLGDAYIKQEAWINQTMIENRTIINIGPDFGRADPSNYYIIENSSIRSANYPTLIPTNPVPPSGPPVR